MTEYELVEPPVRLKREGRRRAMVIKQHPKDDFQTPPSAVEYLFPFIRRDKEVWDPCDGKGNIVLSFIRNGYDAWGSDIKRGSDFLLNTGISQRAVIVTNPPYSIVDRWIEHCYRLGSPFALLMPLTAIGAKGRKAMWSKHGIQMMLLPDRIDFETPFNRGKQGGAWFETAWFCWKLNLPSDLYFAPSLE